MPHAVTAVAPGLQALILCGPGSSFPTFTTNPDENPKALLPIANRPMVWYPLSFCYRVGITNITLVCPPTAQDALNASLKTNPFLTSLPLPTPTLLAPKDLTFNTGTADILRLKEVKAAITTDFLVLPCDLICELGGDKLVQAWMVKAAALGSSADDDKAAPRSGGLGVWYDTKTAPIKGEEKDFIATTPLSPPAVAPPAGSALPHLSNLVMSMPRDTLNDVTEERGGFPVRTGLLRSHPRVRMSTGRRDAHIYIFPRWIVDFVSKNEHLESIAEDVVGWWAKAGWQEGLVTKLGLDKVLSGETEQKKEVETEWSSNHSDTSAPSSPSKKSRTMSATGQIDGPASSDDSTDEPKVTIPPMLAYLHPKDPAGPLIRRVDTAQALLAVSLQLAKLPSLEETGTAAAASPFAHARKVAYPEGVRPRTTITRPDCLVADNVIVEEKTSIKESVVGANCRIEEGAKLQGCLLMDGVVVGKGCRLVRCVLGRRSQIGEGSTLMDCEVQENLLVEPRTEEKNTKIMSSSGLEATEEEMQEVLKAMSDTELSAE